MCLCGLLKTFSKQWWCYEDSTGTHCYEFRDNLWKLDSGPSTPLLKEKVCVSFKLLEITRSTPPRFLPSLKQRSFGVYFDLLEFQRENIPAVGYLVGPQILKRTMYSHVWGLFWGLGFHEDFKE